MIITKLELIRTIKSKMFLISLGIAMMMYLASMNSVNYQLQYEDTLKEFLIFKFVGFQTTVSFLVFSLLALVIGVFSFDDAVFLILSKPLTRRRYLLEKFVAHGIILSSAVISFSVLTITSLKKYGLVIGHNVVFITCTLLLLSLVQLLLLGYLVSFKVRSYGNRLITALIIFLLLSGFSNSLSKQLAREEALEEFNRIEGLSLKSPNEVYSLSPEKVTEFGKIYKFILRGYQNYLFFNPQVQSKRILEDLFETTYSESGSRTQYLGIKNSLKRNFLAVLYLFSMTFIYLGLLFSQFRHKDLR